MNNPNDIIHDVQIQKALSDLHVQMHIPSEILLAYVCGELSGEVCDRIEGHLTNCSECREILDLAKQSASWEREAMAQAATSPLPIHVPPKIESKLQLVATVNRKRKDIAEDIAKLLLPEDSWDSIALLISAREKWQEKAFIGHIEACEDMLAAAFASAAGPRERGEFEYIAQAVDFTNLACDLVSERSCGLNELEQTLPECITEAIFVLKNIEPNEDLRRQLMAVFMQNLFKDEA